MQTDDTAPPGVWLILQQLLQRGDVPHDGRAVDWLEAQGCRIEHRPGFAPRLLATAPAVWGDFIQWRLGDDPPVVQVFGQTASTQDAARRLVDGAGAEAHGALVIAVEQTAGRGRLGRQWQSPAGAGITFSLVHLFNVGHTTATLDRLVAASAVGAAIGLERAMGDPQVAIEIKWPNDLLVHGRKIGGILVETHAVTRQQTAAIIGVGINVGLDPAALAAIDPALPAQVTSVAQLGHPEVDRLAVLADVIEAVRQALYRTPDTALLDEWRSRNLMVGQRLHLRSDGRDILGEVVDLDLQQGLIVRTDAGSIVHLPAASTTVVQRGL